MKLYYYQHDNSVRNFGDDLNPWIFNRLFPDCFKQDDNIRFIGIGTILNSKTWPDSKTKIVFSSGVGYGELPAINENWKIYCVRGPLTAEKLNLPKHLAIADGAILAKNLYQPSAKKEWEYSFMPHLWQSMHGTNQKWQKVCERLGFGFIDPQDSVDEVLKKITETEILITEALHGAIIADTFRIPWIPVKSNHYILEFKWRDWCASIQKEYNPAPVYPFWDSIDNSVINILKSRFKIELNGRELKKIIKNVKPMLSDGKIFSDNLNRLTDRCHEFYDDYKKGMFDAIGN